MNEVDLDIQERDHYQRVIHEFDRIPSGASLKVVSNSDPGWIVNMIEELRSEDLVGWEFTGDDNHEYGVTLRKNRHVS